MKAQERGQTHEVNTTLESHERSRCSYFDIRMLRLKFLIRSLLVCAVAAIFWLMLSYITGIVRLIAIIYTSYTYKQSDFIPPRV